MWEAYCELGNQFEVPFKGSTFGQQMRFCGAIIIILFVLGFLTGCQGSGSGSGDSFESFEVPAWYFDVHPSTEQYRALVASHSPLGTCTYGAMGPLIQVFYDAHPYNLAADDIWIMGEDCLIETVNCGTYAYVTDFIDGIAADVLKMTVIGHQNPSSNCFWLGDYVCSMFSRGWDYRVDCSYRPATEVFEP